MPIEFRCPQCQKLLRVGDDAAGKQAKCPGCGDPVTVPAPGASPHGGANDPFMAPPPVPPQTFTDNPYAAPLTGGIAPGGLGGGLGPAWERDGASISSLIATIKDCFSSPTQFFGTMRTEGGIMQPLVFYFIVNAIVAVVGFGFQFALQGVMMGAMPQQQGGPNPMAMMAGFGAFGVMGLIAMMVFIPLGLFINAGLFHLGLMIFGGANRPFETTFRAVSYAAAAAVIGLIPVCGSSIQGLVTLVFCGIGLCYAHNTDGWRAALAVIAPLACCVGAIFGLVFLFVGIAAVGGAANQNMNPGFQPQPMDPNQFPFDDQQESFDLSPQSEYRPLDRDAPRVTFTQFAERFTMAS
jgi:hypothetical protein